MPEGGRDGDARSQEGGEGCLTRSMEEVRRVGGEMQGEDAGAGDKTVAAVGVTLCTGG